MARPQTLPQENATLRPKHRFWTKVWLGVRYSFRAVIDLARYCLRRPNFPAGALSYDDYWDVREPVLIGTRFRALATLVEEGSSVLDLGCGEGTLLEFLEQERSIRGFGVDVSPRAVEKVRARGLDAVVADISSGEVPSGSYDHVICGEFLEHIAEPERVLLAIKPALRGTLLVSLPNVAYYPDRFRLLFGRFPVQWLHHPAEHLRYFSVRDAIDWSNDLGFSVRSVQAVTGFPVLMKLWPNLFAQQVVYELEVADHE